MRGLRIILLLGLAAAAAAAEREMKTSAELSGMDSANRELVLEKLQR